MKNKSILFTARTGLFLAIAVLFQSLRFIFPGLALINLGFTNGQTLLIGTLVNLTLYLATSLVSVWSGVIIAILTPIIAFMQGHIPIPAMILVVMFGNLALVLIFDLIKKNDITVALILASLVKAIVLYFSVKLIIVPYILPTFYAQKAAKLSIALLSGFSWIQFVTAVLGGIIAIILIPTIKKGMK